MLGGTVLPVSSQALPVQMFVLGGPVGGGAEVAAAELAVSVVIAVI